MLNAGNWYLNNWKQETDIAFNGVNYYERSLWLIEDFMGIVEVNSTVWEQSICRANDTWQCHKWQFIITFCYCHMHHFEIQSVKCSMGLAPLETLFLQHSGNRSLPSNRKMFVNSILIRTQSQIIIITQIANTIWPLICTLNCTKFQTSMLFVNFPLI